MEKREKNMKYNCPYDKKCGGCNLLKHDYAEQLKIKKAALAKLLAPYGRLTEVIGMDEPLHYRNKVHAVFTTDRKGNVISGVYEEGTHKVVAVDNCLIENEKADEIIATIRKLIPSFKLKVYDEDRRTGLFRHVLIRTAHSTGQIMVVLVLSSTMFPSKNNFVKALLKEHPEITTIVMNINDKRTSMVLGDREQTLYGKGYIEDVLCGNTFRISPKSFYQINSVQTEILYNKAIEFAGLTGNETVIDAYCGIGTIGITAASYMAGQAGEKGGNVIGVELNSDAVKDAIANAKRNNMDNIRFYCDDAGKFMTRMAADGQHADVVFMDPPRSGSDETFLNCVAKLAPKKIVYISCGPDTLARDLGVLKKKGYRVEKMVGVDLFPMTGHVETVVLLSQLKQKPDDYIDVTIELDDVDITSAETKATYDEIKKYVAEHNAGMKVSNLYISQVKRKCGIEVGKNYNLPKNEDSRQPQCPEDKERAIVEALEHFKMIQQK
jgi:23S rRNA (uracil1939-C5)-methyltransferase